MLERYSFVRWNKDQQSYAMHKLVHVWGYDRLTEDEQLKFSCIIFELIVKAIDGCGNAPEDKFRRFKAIYYSPPTHKTRSKSRKTILQCERMAPKPMGHESCACRGWSVVQTVEHDATP